MRPARAGVKAIILVEHDMDLVAEYATRIVALQGGKVLADRAPDEFFADPEMIASVIGKRAGSGREARVTARCSPSTGSSSTSRRAASCAASRSRSPPASWSAWSAATAPARRRPFAPSWE